MKAASLILTFLLVSALVQGSELLDNKELHDLILKAKDRRESLAKYLLAVYHGTTDKCQAVPEVTHGDRVAEDCLQGFNVG